MNSEKEENAIFVNGVRKWWMDLNTLVSEIKARGNRPILVALSRKMPRLMHWISSNSDCLNDVNPQLLETNELITELAIPFLYFQLESNNIEFVILDDVIIHGTTLRTVYENLKALFHVNILISCIFRHERAEIRDFVDPADYSRMTEIPQATVDLYTELIAEKVKTSQLPIDMEFPIFRINQPIDTISENMRNAQLTDRIIGLDEIRITLDLKSRNMVSSNVDFCKARYFSKGEHTVLEIFSPMTITEQDLVSLKPELFDNGLYSALWERLTRNIRIALNPEYGENDIQTLPSLRDSFVRSLAVIGNYLYSISALCLNKKEILPDISDVDITLTARDLSLLIGEKLTIDIAPIIMTIVKTNEVVQSMREKYLSVPISFAPSTFETELEGEKFASSLNASKPAEIFDRIFNYQHYTNPKFENPYLTYERLFFGETVESLKKVMSFFFDADANLNDLQKWIDENIDAGYIIPKYEKIKAENGTTYWRRYFHAGIRRKLTRDPALS